MLPYFINLNLSKLNSTDLMRHLAIFKLIWRFFWAAIYLACLSSCLSSPPLAATDVYQSGMDLRLLSQQAEAKTFSNGKSLTISQNGDVLISNVPFAKQGRDNTCGQAAMAMLLHYWAVEIDYLQIAREGNPLNIATSRDAIYNYLTSKGLSAEPLNGNLTKLLEELHQARPVLLLLDYGGLTRLHYVVIVGYNARDQKLIIHESNTSPYQEMALDEFLMRWQNLPVVALPLLGGQAYYQLMFSVRPKAAL